MTLLGNNNDVKLAKLMGLAGIVAGGAQVLAPDRMQRLMGLAIPAWLMRTMGLRGFITGCAVFAHSDEAPPIGMRLAGDALELAMLGRALLPGRKVTNGALVSTALVLAATALDLSAGVSLRRRQQRVLETARRTRVRPA